MGGQGKGKRAGKREGEREEVTVVEGEAGVRGG